MYRILLTVLKLDFPPETGPGIFRCRCCGLSFCISLFQFNPLLHALLPDVIRFYTDDFFTPMPSLEDDAMPMANLLKARQPHVLTVALDPEGTGPDTHYKVLLVSCLASCGRVDECKTVHA